MNTKFGKLKYYMFICGFVVLIVSLLQYLILRPFEIGFSPDDWIFVFWYKALGENPILKLPEVWQERGPYTTFFLYYLGILVDIWGINYWAIGLTNLSLKVLAIVSVFPMVLLIFKNRLLAFISVLLYSISYSAVGSLEFAVKGADYLSIFFMNSFLMSYYLLVKKGLNSRWLPISCILLTITLISSTIRSYPLLVLIPAVEVFIWARGRTLNRAITGLKRVFWLYLPFILAFIYKPLLMIAILLATLTSPQRILEGNWHLLLIPVQGLGFMMIPLEIWGRFIKPLVFENLYAYGVGLITGGPLLILGGLTIFLSFFASKKPLGFILTILIVNIILQTAAYIMAFHSLGIPSDLRVSFDPPRLYSTIPGIFVISLAISFFREWLSNKKNLLLLALWVTSLSALIFTALIWLLAGLNLSYSETSYYLVVASEGISIFTAAILTLILDKDQQKKWVRIFIKILVVLILLTIFLINKEVINKFFISMSSKGRNYEDQQMIQNRFRKQLNNFDYSKPAFFYFDGSDLGKDGTFFGEAFLSTFPHWFHVKDNKLIDGCAEVFYADRIQLASLIQVKDGEKGILYKSLCVKDGKAWNQEMFYKKENIYAFKLKNRDFVDIKLEILEELGL